MQQSPPLQPQSRAILAYLIANDQPLAVREWLLRLLDGCSTTATGIG